MPPFTSTGLWWNGLRVSSSLVSHHQQTIMVQTYQDNREEGTTIPVTPQETKYLAWVPRSLKSSAPLRVSCPVTSRPVMATARHRVQVDRLFFNVDTDYWTTKKSQNRKIGRYFIYKYIYIYIFVIMTITTILDEHFLKTLYNTSIKSI